MKLKGICFRLVPLATGQTRIYSHNQNSYGAESGPSVLRSRPPFLIFVNVWKTSLDRDFTENVAKQGQTTTNSTLNHRRTLCL
jgi:hypothetical protein